MKCHYEVLNVPRDADFEEIKKSYRKLAIKWHPDKNLDDPVGATEQFQLLQQAFEVLSDPHERKWYDDHREAILKGKSSGQFDDDSLDVYEFFTTTCFKGYGDDGKGFYAVYREVFNKISAEDSEYQTNEDSDFEIPNFGKSDSSFEEVNAFYAYWQSYSTKKSYAWLDPFDVREAPNRRVSKLIEKENKKVRDKARKARNEEIRELVGFVRKRDKRVQAYAKHLKDVAAEKAKKSEEQRIQKIKERNVELASFKESEWSKFSNVEKELKTMEANLAAEFGDQLSSDDASDEESVLLDSLYCIACEKLFKNPKGFENHELSKKHKENVKRIKDSMLEDDAIDGEEDLPGDAQSEENFDEDQEEIDGGSKSIEDTESEGTSSDDEDHIKAAQNKEDDQFIDEAEESVPDIDEAGVSVSDIDESEESFSDIDESEESFSDIEEYEEMMKILMSKYSGESAFVPDCSDEKPRKLSKKQKKKQRQNNKLMSNSCDEKKDSVDCDIKKLEQQMVDNLGLSKKQRKKQLQMNRLIDNKSKRVDAQSETLESLNSTVIESSLPQTTENSSLSPNSSSLQNAECNDLLSEIKTKNTEQKVKKEKNSEKERKVNNNSSTSLTCQVCKSKFPSKNKLFQHLEKTKHAVLIPEKSAEILNIKNPGKISNSKKKSRK